MEVGFIFINGLTHLMFFHTRIDEVNINESIRSYQLLFDVNQGQIYSMRYFNCYSIK